MEVTRRRSPEYFFNSSVFATAILCLIALETASAWRRDLCIPGDIYMDSTSTPLPPGASCQFCTDWCDEQCLVLGLPQVNYGCLVSTYSIRCRCCCGRSPPSPSSPPSPALPPPAPQSQSEFEGLWPQHYNICLSGQEYRVFYHEDGLDCIQKPVCEEYCNRKNVPMARSECVSGGSAYPEPRYEWFEQCCCADPSPPPSPSPPPPDPCSKTCLPELSVQISPGHAPCTYGLLESSRSLTVTADANNPLSTN
ncbi:hypothetical protein MKW92_021006 [Papaver armeniacum]|nr:hypothetical protein MKW92_021006 [Papaver armeniacum]